MIDPVSAAGAAGALAEITGSMTGMSIAQAYEQNMTGTYDPYDPTQGGLQYGYGNKTTETPAISGDTEGTFEDSQQSDPEQAWLDWMHDGGLVNPTTGGAVIGSSGSTINYSLMEDQNGDPQAVQPVAISRDTAIVAMAQCLGVSMKIAEVDPVFAGKMTQAIIAAGVVYDKARDLFTCWWDGVNMLFPKKAVEALDDLFDEEGILDPSGYHYDGAATLAGNIDSVATGGGTLNYTYPGGSAMFYEFTPLGDGIIVAKQEPDGSIGVDIFSKSGTGGATVKNQYGQTSTSKPTNSFSTLDTDQISFKKSNYTGIPSVWLPIWSGAINTFNQAFFNANSTMQTRSIGTVLYNGAETGDMPEGTSKSLAPAYTPGDLVTKGAIVGKNRAGEYEYTPVVPIALPENPADTTASTENPTGSTNPERTKENEKEVPIPLPIPGTTESDPTVELTNPAEVNAEKIDELVEDLANTVDPQPPQSKGLIPIPPFMPGIPVDPDDPSAGSQFPTIVPSSGSGFIHVYNPTPAEFVAFGHWLWVTYADATIDKIWNNPFDGVLGAHELYATPGVSGRDNIRSGFLVCPTSANLVPNRYTEIDCGTVVVPEFYGNYLDYSPYSQCYIYLPFIGINEVSIDDIVGHAVNIRYRVDSYSGACIAMIYVAKQGYRNLCYQFAGNCSVEVPLAGGSQAAIKAGMMQAEAYGRAAIQSAQIQKTAKIGTGIVQGAHAGAGAGAFNPVAGIVGGLLGGLAGGTAGYIQGAADYGAAKLSAGAMQDAARVANKSSVQHSGQLGASHGAMVLKVPFIMVRNPIQVKVTNYNQDYGFPAHKRVVIGGCTGYLRVKEVNVISAHATNEEKIAIEEALKNGVYVS